MRAPGLVRRQPLGSGAPWAARPGARSPLILRPASASRLLSRHKPASAEASRRAPERGRGGIAQRHQAVLVAAVFGQALGHDDLIRAVDRELGESPAAACRSPPARRGAPRTPWRSGARHRCPARRRTAATPPSPRSGSPRPQGRRRRVVRRLAPLLPLVFRHDRRQVQLRAHQMRRMARRHEVVDRRRQQPHLIHVPRPKGLAHARR